MSALEQLGRAIALAQDEALEDPRELEDARERFVAPQPQPWQRRVLRRRPAMVLAAATLALVALGVWLVRPGSEPLTFDVDGAARRGVVGEWITAPPHADVPLRFSDGSTMLLGGGSRARVEELTPHGASVALERGRAAVSVTPREDSRWRFRAGPFDVTVTGTRFDVAWDPATEVFSISLHDGSVVVAGPKIEGERALVAGQQLRIDVGEERADELGELGAAGGGAASEPADEPARSDSSLAAGEQGAAGGAVEPELAVPDDPFDVALDKPPEDWRELARKGEYKDAVAAAEAAGFDSICARAPAGELMSLGDAALYAGQPARARQAYQAVRKRYGGSSQAALAAFRLGRLAFHGGGGYGNAIRWFNVYLQEAPSGPLAREALGRIMEAQSHGRDPKAAKNTARRYLALYPGGPHAELAKKLLEK